MENRDNGQGLYAKRVSLDTEGSGPGSGDSVANRDLDRNLNTCRTGTQVKTSKNLSARNDYCFSSEMPLYYRTANKIKN